ncbi:ABC transporter permease [Halobacteriales archaeon QS_1_68_20]|nr:MAG: ABC transporter permease [Halobacteriales archaeon QS_1_68_20]
MAPNDAPYRTDDPPSGRQDDRIAGTVDDPASRDGDAVDDQADAVWTGPVPRTTFLRWRPRVVAGALGTVAVAAVADASGAGPGWRVLDWLYVASLVVLLGYVVAPLVVDRAAAARYREALAGNRLAMASLGYVVALLVVGTVGPWLVGPSTTNLGHSFQPPMFSSVPESLPANCVGQVADLQCQGTAQYPLGTNGQGEDMLRVLVRGTRVAVQVALVASTLLVPVGIAVGLVAGYRGGLTDQVLMRYVDVQSAVPAFLVYLVLLFVVGRSLFLLVVVFGLLSWGEVARLVRGEVRQRRDAAYVQAATVAGAGPLYVVRRVLLPNVSGPVLTVVSRQASMLVLIEAALAFMELSETGAGSWGETIARGMNQWFPVNWWISTLPVIALACTVVAFNVLGDALRDAVDPG